MSGHQGDGNSSAEILTEKGIFDVLADVDGPVILSADVADYFDCTTATAREKLDQLHQDGQLNRRKVSQRIIYWRSERDGEFDAGGLRGDPTTTLDRE